MKTMMSQYCYPIACCTSSDREETIRSSSTVCTTSIDAYDTVQARTFATCCTNSTRKIVPLVQSCSGMHTHTPFAGQKDQTLKNLIKKGS